MSTRILRVSLIFLLALQILHLPLPCPDLDGECRGAPIVKLTDANAWHLLIAGVRPNDDIDRGPFRHDESQRKTTPSESPYGDLALTSATSSVAFATPADLLERTIHGIATLPSVLDVGAVVCGCDAHALNCTWTLDARTLRARVCVWRI